MWNSGPCLEKDASKTFFEAMNVRLSISQRSLLGSFLFIVFINDLPTSFINVLAHLANFADDANCFFSCQTEEELLHVAGSSLEQAENRLCKNQLLLNSKKLLSFVLTSLVLLSQNIEPSTHVKFLSFSIDQNFKINKN